MNKILLLGAVLGLSSIMMAAYTDHSLALHLIGNSLHGLLTAVRYHQLYAVVISMIGLTIPLQVNTRVKSWLTRSAYILTVGIILFSIGIYISVMTGVAGMLYLTPIGGVILMIGWGCLVRTALLRTK